MKERTLCCCPKFRWRHVYHKASGQVTPGCLPHLSFSSRLSISLRRSSRVLSFRALRSHALDHPRLVFTCVSDWSLSRSTCVRNSQTNCHNRSSPRDLPMNPLEGGHRSNTGQHTLNHTPQADRPFKATRKHTVLVRSNLSSSLCSPRFEPMSDNCLPFTTQRLHTAWKAMLH